ncbi:hypothetical protein IF1G_01388 [Cordyceps javanica]|uniref:Uncharacterized protein n=1 Tax=Cordyceps javanica TaxID=43265 RepID=A0A545VBV7_9HYPO|nr:hypothetical protein IF1G_01388 [Cordyceps javanica]
MRNGITAGNRITSVPRRGAAGTEERKKNKVLSLRRPRAGEVRLPHHIATKACGAPAKGCTKKTRETGQDLVKLTAWKHAWARPVPARCSSCWVGRYVGRYLPMYHNNNHHYSRRARPFSNERAQGGFFI